MFPEMSTALHPPRLLHVKGGLWTEWNKHHSEFHFFTVTIRLDTQGVQVQAAMFDKTTVEEGRRTYRTFHFEDENSWVKLELLTDKSEQHCMLATNLMHHKFIFKSKEQRENETFDDWLTELCTSAQNCKFKEIKTQCYATLSTCHTYIRCRPVAKVWLCMTWERWLSGKRKGLQELWKA